MPRTPANREHAILDAAEALFASRPYHEVRLEDVAVSAKVGKGTLYLYWDSKEALYLALIRRGFESVLASVERELPHHRGDCWAQIRAVVRALIDFGFSHPGVYRIMRSGFPSLTPEDPALLQIRSTLSARVEQIIHEGVSAGQINDPAPALTTQYLLAFIRGVMLYPPDGLTRDALENHVMRVFQHGLSTTTPTPSSSSSSSSSTSSFSPQPAP